MLATLEAERPEACVIDSIQTLHAEGMTGAPGSVGQVREAATAIMEVAKRIGCAVILVGHVTKEGAVAGPRVLEHLVDCVLFFEGERERSFRTLRALKNRFGATSEVGVFEMRSGGLVEVVDPSARFVGEASAAPGSVVLCSMEGTRPLLVEVQALVAPTEIVPPRRVANGIDRNRLAMVLAVLARHGGPSLAGADVFVNVAGGVRVDEPGADLAVALALVSAQRGEPLADADGRPLACFGEVGLTGELRSVGHADRRAAEARQVRARPGARARAARETARRRRAPVRDACARRPCAALERRATSGGRRAGDNGRLTSANPTSPHGIGRGGATSRPFAIMNRCRTPGDELNELEARQDPRLLAGARHGRPGHSAARGDRQHHPRAHRRADRGRRCRRRLVPVLRRDRLDVDYTPGAALPGREDGRRDRAAASGRAGSAGRTSS